MSLLANDSLVYSLSRLLASGLRRHCATPEHYGARTHHERNFQTVHYSLASH